MTHNIFLKQKFLQPAILIACFAILSSSCAVKVAPFSSKNVEQFANDKYNRVAKNQEPISKEITLYEAMARAIKYNLDYRVETMNQVLAQKNLKLAKADMLPSLVANGGWTYRNNSSASSVSRIIDGRRVSDPSSSQDDGAFMGDVTFSWHILDFGLSYIRAKQSADEVLIANERKRRVINNIIENVRTTYWRAVSAEQLIEGFEDLKVKAENALAQSRKLYANQESAPLPALRFQRELVSIKRQIHRLEQELRTAKIQLSALMNVPPNSKYSLHIPKRKLTSLKLKSSTDKMMKLALRNRPELLEIGYQKRINEAETKSALLELVPSLSLNVGANHNDNSFLLNDAWISHGAQVGWNLMKVFSYPVKADSIRAQKELLDSRALATSMAIMVQVYAARARYEHVYNSAKAAREYYVVQQNVQKQLQAQVNAQTSSAQSLIQEEMNTLVAAVEYDIAYADLQNAFAAIYVSIGADPYDVNITSDMSVNQLAKILKRVWQKRGDKHI